MMDTDRLFWERRGSMVHYPGLLQGGKQRCVYASIGGAINHLSGRSVWQTETLYRKCTERGVTQPTFDCVIPVAIDPVPEEVAFEIPREEIKHDVDKYMEVVRDCVANEGIAIASLEGSWTAPPDVERMGRYHMISLVARVDRGYQVWDTNEGSGFLTDEELRTGFCYSPVPYLVLHPQHDCILLRKWPVP